MLQEKITDGKYDGKTESHGRKTDERVAERICLSHHKRACLHLAFLINCREYSKLPRGDHKDRGNEEMGQFVDDGAGKNDKNQDGKGKSLAVGQKKYDSVNETRDFLGKEIKDGKEDEQ